MGPYRITQDPDEIYEPDDDSYGIIDADGHCIAVVETATMAEALLQKLAGPPPQYVIHCDSNGVVECLGSVLIKNQDTVEIQMVDAIMLVAAGIWSLSDEVTELPKKECRFFLSIEATLQEYARLVRFAEERSKPD